MKIVANHIVIICPVCEEKIKYTPPKDFKAYKDKKIMVFSKLKQEEIDHYTVRIYFDQNTTYDIPYSAFQANEMRMSNGPYSGSPGKTKMGWLSCLHYGTNKIITFKKVFYYFQIPFKERIIYARTLDALLSIRNQFSQDLHFNELPELDYPKVFWQNRLELVRKIDQF